MSSYFSVRITNGEQREEQVPSIHRRGEEIDPRSFDGSTRRLSRSLSPFIGKGLWVDVKNLPARRAERLKDMGLSSTPAALAVEMSRVKQPWLF